MPGPIAAVPPLFAQVQGGQAAAPQGESIFGLNYLPFLWIPLLFYFLFIRPNMQQERKRKEMLGALKKNDRVLTSAGIYGTVVSIDPEADKVVLRVDDDRGLKLAFSRGSVVRVVEPTTEKAAEPV